MLDSAASKFIFTTVIYLLYLVFVFPYLITQKSTLTPFIGFLVAFGGVYVCSKLFQEAVIEDKKED